MRLTSMRELNQGGIGEGVELLRAGCGEYGGT